ncbi:MAG: AAA+ ATPase superfamily predicted ATPase [Candidatus Paceibacteria bacterium]|jgi:AAA+ ATPase superfamily predicted ATPase
MFIGRDEELGVLNQLADRGNPELFVLYGRRRVGKTELLQQFCEGRRAVYFQAAQLREKDNLRAYREALADGLEESIAAVNFPDWETALEFTCERANDKRLVVVIDEFPYLCEANKGLPSVLQRFWDKRGKNSTLMLVLCGSQVSFMEEQVLSEKSPLFGRRTAQKRLQPLSPPRTIGFFPKWSVQDRMLAYSILGGMPAYLRRFDDSRSLRENIMQEILRPEGYLFEEVQFLLRNELSSPTTYNSILAAIACGDRKVGDVALTVGVDSTTANKYLSVLRDLGLVERRVPITDPDPLRSRRGTYHIADRFVAFHFRHVQPAVSLVNAGRGGRVLEESVEPDFGRLFDSARQDFILDHLRREAAELVGEEVIEYGPFDGNYVRAVGRGHKGATIAAIVVPEGRPNEAKLVEELEMLRTAFGDEIIKLSYGITDRPDRVLEVERVPEGDLL